MIPPAVEVLPSGLVVCSVCRYGATTATLTVLYPGIEAVIAGRLIRGPWQGYICDSCKRRWGQ